MNPERARSTMSVRRHRPADGVAAAFQSFASLEQPRRSSGPSLPGVRSAFTGKSPSSYRAVLGAAGDRCFAGKSNDPDVEPRARSTRQADRVVSIGKTAVGHACLIRCAMHRGPLDAPHEPDDQKNHQNGSENSADVHVRLRWIMRAVKHDTRGMVGALPYAGEVDHVWEVDGRFARQRTDDW